MTNSLNSLYKKARVSSSVSSMHCVSWGTPYDASNSSTDDDDDDDDAAAAVVVDAENNDKDDTNINAKNKNTEKDNNNTPTAAGETISGAGGVTEGFEVVSSGKSSSSCSLTKMLTSGPAVAAGSVDNNNISSNNADSITRKPTCMDEGADDAVIPSTRTTSANSSAHSCRSIDRQLLSSHAESIRAAIDAIGDRVGYNTDDSDDNNISRGNNNNDGNGNSSNDEEAMENEEGWSSSSSTSTDDDEDSGDSMTGVTPFVPKSVGSGSGSSSGSRTRNHHPHRTSSTSKTITQSTRTTTCTSTSSIMSGADIIITNAFSVAGATEAKLEHGSLYTRHSDSPSPHGSGNSTRSLPLSTTPSPTPPRSSPSPSPSSSSSISRRSASNRDIETGGYLSRQRSSSIGINNICSDRSEELRIYVNTDPSDDATTRSPEQPRGMAAVIRATSGGHGNIRRVASHPPPPPPEEIYDVTPRAKNSKHHKHPNESDSDDNDDDDEEGSAPRSKGPLSCGRQRHKSNKIKNKKKQHSDESPPSIAAAGSTTSHDGQDAETVDDPDHTDDEDEAMVSWICKEQVFVLVILCGLIVLLIGIMIIAAALMKLPVGQTPPVKPNATVGETGYGETWVDSMEPTPVPSPMPVATTISSGAPPPTITSPIATTEPSASIAEATTTASPSLEQKPLQEGMANTAPPTGRRHQGLPIILNETLPENP